MDNLEMELLAANNRLHAKKIHYAGSTRISQLRSSMSISELQLALKRRAEEVGRANVSCQKCGNTYQEYRSCDVCLQAERQAAQDKRDREKWQAMRSAKRENLSKFLKACGVPKIFLDVPSEHTSQSLFLTGQCGTGKSHRAAGILKGFVMRLPCQRFVEPFENTPLFVTVPELLLDLRSAFSGAKTSEADLVQKYTNAQLLVLDDLGTEKMSDYVLQSLYVVINKRYCEQSQTIITSNLGLGEIGAKLSDRIASRIAGMCHIVKLTGDDRRLAVKKP